VALSQRFAQSKKISGASTLFYEATPRLVIASYNFTSGLELDLRRNSVRAIANKSPASEPVRANLARSVADAAIEGDVLMFSSHFRRNAAIDIFDQARTQGIPLAVFHGGAPLNGLQVSDLARARMGDEGPAAVLVAPERAPAGEAYFAWWKLDPSNGEAITTLDTGLNGFQDLPEEGVIETNVISPMAQTLSGPYNPISPMAQTMNLGSQFTQLPVQLAGQGNPWAMCSEFTGEMMMELLRALTAVGEDTSLL
jgi:hypothetical protein